MPTEGTESWWGNCGPCGGSGVKWDAGLGSFTGRDCPACGGTGDV